MAERAPRRVTTRRLGRDPHRSAGYSQCADTLRPPRASRPRRFRRCGDPKLGHAHEIGGGDDVLALGVRAFDAAVATLAEATGGLRPTEDLLDALAQFLADRVREGEQHVESFLAVL